MLVAARCAAVTVSAAIASLVAAGCGAGRADGQNLPALTGKSLGQLTSDSARSSGDPSQPAEVLRIGPVEASAGILDARARVGEPEGGSQPAVAAPAPARPEDAQARPPVGAASVSADGALVESLVGQINGRPLFASEFFAPMDARLRAEAAQLPPQRWVMSARAQIRQGLRERLLDELLISEFEASLTPEQRQGVLAFVESLRSELVSESLGSEALAARRSLEEEGLTLDERVRIRRDQELIRAQIRKVLGNRVYVPWREIELQYEREFNRFNPPAKATLRMIQVRTRDQERVDRVASALAGGEPFAEVATRESLYAPGTGGMHSVTLDEHVYSEATIFGDDSLNERARALTIGEITGPFEWSGRQVWLTLESIERPPPESLYDAQLELGSELRGRLFDEEQGKYFQQLISRSANEDLSAIETRLLEIAVRRYFPNTAGG